MQKARYNSHTKLPYNESEHHSIKIGIAYLNWCSGSTRSKEEVFCITDYLDFHLEMLRTYILHTKGLSHSPFPNFCNYYTRLPARGGMSGFAKLTQHNALLGSHPAPTFRHINDWLRKEKLWSKAVLNKPVMIVWRLSFKGKGYIYVSMLCSILFRTQLSTLSFKKLRVVSQCYFHNLVNYFSMRKKLAAHCSGYFIAEQIS